MKTSVRPKVRPFEKLLLSESASLLFLKFLSPYRFIIGSCRVATSLERHYTRVDIECSRALPASERCFVINREMDWQRLHSS